MTAPPDPPKPTSLTTLATLPAIPARFVEQHMEVSAFRVNVHNVIAHMTEEAAQAAVDVARETHVTPVRVTMRYCSSLALVFGAAIAFILYHPPHVDSTVIGAGVIALGALGASVPVASKKFLEVLAATAKK